MTEVMSETKLNAKQENSESYMVISEESKLNNLIHSNHAGIRMLSTCYF